MLCYLVISGDPEGCHELWLVGDNFMSSTYREHFMKRRGTWFMKDEFELGTFCNSRFASNNTNILSRILNTFVNAVNKRVKLPKVLIFLLDADLIEDMDLGYDVTITAILFGTWLEWLVAETNAVIEERIKQLPQKAVIKNEPFVYWVAIPNHKGFSFDERARFVKYNNCLESVLQSHSNMRMVKIKGGWDQDDSNLVVNGRIMVTGLDQLWQSLDLSIAFNVRKREEYLMKMAVNNLVTSCKGKVPSVTQDHKDPML